MPKELHSDDLPIDQKPPVTNFDDYDGEIVKPNPELLAKEYADELSFMEEPVVIRLEPSVEKNASMFYPVWVNGQGAEVFQGGRWNSITWLPVGQNLTIKRKYLEVIIRSKVDTLRVDAPEATANPYNEVHRSTTAVHSFSVIEDRNPRGAAWVTEMRRRNY